MTDAIMPSIQFAIIIALFAVIVLRHKRTVLDNTLLKMIILLSIGLRVMDELSNTLFGVDILSVEANWIVRWCMLAAVALFLLHSEQKQRAETIEATQRAELERENERLRQESLILLREKEAQLEFIRSMDERTHRQPWDTIVRLNTVASRHTAN